MTEHHQTDASSCSWAALIGGFEHSNLNLCRAFWRPAVEIAFARESILVSACFSTAKGNGLVLLRLRTLQAMANGVRTKTKE